MDAFNARSFRINGWVIACRMGGWAYERSAVMVEVSLCIGNKSPEVVDAVDTVIGGLEKDRGDSIGEKDNIIVRGLSINWEEEHLGCCEG
jgi:hypothetical protein